MKNDLLNADLIFMDFKNFLRITKLNFNVEFIKKDGDRYIFKISEDNKNFPENIMEIYPSIDQAKLEIKNFLNLNGRVKIDKNILEILPLENSVVYPCSKCDVTIDYTGK